jgi:hypothetical protein
VVFEVVFAVVFAVVFEVDAIGDDWGKRRVIDMNLGSRFREVFLLLTFKTNVLRKLK